MTDSIGNFLEWLKRSHPSEQYASISKEKLAHLFDLVESGTITNREADEMAEAMLNKAILQVESELI